MKRKEIFVRYDRCVGCHACEDAPCVVVCPTGAMRKRADGVSVSNVQQCIGCWMCALVARSVPSGAARARQ